MINLDGTKQKTKLGANAILAVSMAIKKLSAKEKKIPLYKNFFIKNNFKLPYPLMNVIIMELMQTMVLEYKNL